MSVNLYHPYVKWLVGRLEPRLGDGQIYCREATPYKDLTQHLKPLLGGEMWLMTYNYAPQDWDEKDWKNWLRAQKEKGVVIRLVGGKPKRPEALRDLLEDRIIECRVISRAPTTHLGLFTHPKQLWFEGFHKDGPASDCYFTSAPYDESWSSAQCVFKELWTEGKEFPLELHALEQNDSVVTPAVNPGK